MLLEGSKIIVETPAWYDRLMSVAKLFVAVAATLSIVNMTSSRAQQRPSTPSSAAVAGYRVVKVYPHDRQAFTQGLQYVDGFLYESTGQHGQSGIRKVKLETGEVLQHQPLDSKYFGEGITVWGDTIVQLTWQSEIGFVYDKKTFKQLRSFTYAGEGWGLTHDGTRLIMSDGNASGTLRFLDAKTLKEAGRLVVRDGGRPVDDLNELEYVRGEILANVWMTQRIARISRKTGEVTGWIDLSGLLNPREAAGTDVLNGIAYDAAGDRLFVTGKLWPKLFEIKIVPRS
jgi:glutaminyl-peptide cyclotransferase